jgi:uncharacterized membrane protein
MAQTTLYPDSPVHASRIRRVAPDAPFRWLAQGWNDMWRAASISLVYGVVAAAVGGLLLWLSRDYTHLAPALTSGFLLVAPALAINLYAVSRRLERAEPIDSVHLFDDWRHNRGSIGLFGLGLAFVLLAWERICAILFALFYGGEVPDLARFASEVWFSGAYLELVAAYLLVGGALAAIVFCLSVVSLPLMLDRTVDPATAVMTSIGAARANPGSMLLWAASIAILTAIGFATLMIGLIVIFPVLAHASWHCYRDLVEPAS